MARINIIIHNLHTFNHLFSRVKKTRVLLHQVSQTTGLFSSPGAELLTGDAADVLQDVQMVREAISADGPMGQLIHQDHNFLNKQGQIIIEITIEITIQDHYKTTMVCFLVH
jgi:selenophosphate synthetase-related protein